MLIMAILIIFILLGFGLAISPAAEEIAAGDEGKWSESAWSDINSEWSFTDLTKEDAAKIATVILVVFTAIYALALCKTRFKINSVYQML